MIDNYSRKILTWCVATRFDVMNTVNILREAVRNAVSAVSTPTLLVDGGSENLNASVDELINDGILSRVIAVKDIRFSNSLIETLWRTMKHQWLFFHPLDTAVTVTRLVAFYVSAYNSDIPHAAFKGQTPDKVYYGTGAEIPGKLEQGKAKARAARLIIIEP